MTHPEPWWHRPFRMFQTNLREVDAGLDVERVLDHLEEFGADAWLLSVGGIIANHPTDLDFQTRNPALAGRPSGDLVGDALAAARARGVRLLARMDFSKVDHRRAERHPEWCFVDPAGEPQVYNGLTSVCPSGDYYQRRLFDVVDEVLDRYPLDGFFFNWMSYNEVDYAGAYRGVCRCLACHRAFASFAPGTDLPTGPDSPAYPLWRRFAAAMIDDLTARVRAHIGARRPEAPLILGDRADIVFHEANNAVGRTLWHQRTAEHVSAAKTFRPGVPVLVNSVGFVDMPYRWAGEEPHHFAQYLVQAIARGANPSTYIMGTPDDVTYECLDVAGEITRFHRDHTEVYRDLVPAARALLVRPDPLESGGGRDEALAEFRGLYSALLERHIPFDVLPEPRLPDVAAQGRLDGYGVVVLPDLGALDPGAVRALDGFTRSGGGVVTTGSSGFDGDGFQLAGAPVRGRLAVRDTVESVRSLHLRRPDPGGGRPRGTLPVVGAFHVVEPAPGAATGLPVLSRAPYGPPEKCHGHVDLDLYGSLSAAVEGGGRVHVLPWTPGRAYHEVGLSGHREVFVEAVLAAADGPVQVDTDLPEQVQVVLGTSAAGRVVHLLNHSGAVPQGFRAPVPVRDHRLRVPWWPEEEGATVTALRAGTACPADGDGRLRIPRLDLFEVLVRASAIKGL
ncbi:Beta-galactosidase trimerisation domain-containing protein [Nocardiopsis flavescens]|uniref:Beta-galactosidase trimerisation domain-containing protein n=1 Tax=Nocardiopsis flavescens TaxID=758803 RepID=A0A1M6LAN1_9ACTN|nr:alpha-amylase family protein [Nocardiopsis flavescens]SHJ68214.1 Beta-galactosidase trimerisation domain-containing protein [Nocardiopsis flavescens]